MAWQQQQQLVRLAGLVWRRCLSPALALLLGMQAAALMVQQVASAST
jgi:hypothetical protein